MRLHALSLLLASVLFVTLLLHTTVAQDSSSSTGEELSSTGEAASSTGINLSSSSTGIIINNSTNGNSTRNSTSSTGAAGPIIPNRACDDANRYARAQNPPGPYVCGCRFNSSALNTTGPTSDYYYSGAVWDANSADDTPWLSDPNYANYFDRVEGAVNVSARGYPQCYGSKFSSNCFDQFDATTVGSSNPSGYARGFYCEDTNNSPSFVKGNASPDICIVYGGGNHLHKMRFQPIVDQFALLTIQSSFNGSEGLAQLGHMGAAFQVELNGVKSDVRHRYGSITSDEYTTVRNADGTAVIDSTGKEVQGFGRASCLVVPFHTIVIHLTQGVLEKITFDDDDSLCSSSYSVDNNCAIDINQCKGSSTYDKTNTATDTDCDFKLYVSWTGTDKDNTFLSSSGRRLSQFRRWSLNAVYNQASNFDTKNLPTVPADE